MNSKKFWLWKIDPINFSLYLVGVCFALFIIYGMIQEGGLLLTATILAVSVFSMWFMNYWGIKYKE